MDTASVSEKDCHRNVYNHRTTMKVLKNKFQTIF